MSTSPAIALIGFGEVGQALGADLRARDHAVAAWDVLFQGEASGPALAIRRAGGVRQAGDLGDALAGAQVVISAVSAAQCEPAAQAAAPALAPGALYLDLNSVSPGVRTRSADLITAAGGRYVEAAVMAAIAPQRLATPMLLGGPHAERSHAELVRLGFTGAKPYSNRIGAASATKMCRSILIKGLEALFTEAMLGARHYQVEQAVLDSLQDLFPECDRRELARYMISRSVLHGKRRAEEMREVARTVREARLAPHMSVAAAARHEASARYAEFARLAPLEPLLDRLLLEERT